MGNLETIEKYWDTRSEGFSKRVRDELKTDHDKWSEKLDFYLKDIEGKKVLDIGCGPGFFTIILSEKGYDVTAFDYSPDMLKEAEKNVQNSGYSAKFVRGDAQNLPFEDEEFDIIVSRNLTWNLESPKKAYEEWLRVLKPKGIIINCDGNHYSYMYRDEYELEREQWGLGIGHNPEYIGNVDTSVIDDIAKDLPLSKQLRPAWDLDFMLEAGVKYAGAETVRHKFKDRDGKERCLIKDFVIKVIK